MVLNGGDSRRTCFVGCFRCVVVNEGYSLLGGLLAFVDPVLIST
jgi:hypothetical protein